MKRLLSVALLTIVVAGFAAAAWGPTVPEIGAGSAASALGLLAGALMVIRARRKQ